AVELEREEDMLGQHGEENDRHAVVVRVAMEPSEQPQDGHRYPFHREPTISLWYRETTEIYGFFQSHPECLEAIVFLRPNVGEQATAPALARLEGRERDTNAGVHGISDLGLGQPKSWSLRHQRCQIPLALERYPLAVADEIGDLRQFLVPHASVRGSDDARRMLALELLRHVLRPRERGSPPDDDRR